MDNPSFESNRTYTRREIQNVLGGDPTSMLPIHQGRVAYCCVFERTHPYAPEIILIGRGRMIESAHKFASQREAVPVFVKSRQKARGWVYQGEFVAKRYTDNPAEIAPYIRKSHRRGIVGVLFLEQISP